MIIPRNWLGRERERVNKDLQRSRRYRQRVDEQWPVIRGVTEVLLRREQENGFSQAMQNLLGGERRE